MHSTAIFRDQHRHYLTGATAALAATLVCFIGSAAQAQDGEWRKRAERDGITTWTREVEGSKYHAVRGETVLESSVERLVTVINDAAACEEWADLCANSYVHRQVSPAEAYVYTLNDMPWPVRDREVLAHVRWQRDDNSVEMVSEAVPGPVESKRGAVRIEQARARWRFTPDGASRTRAEFEIHMDPNGAIPGWLLNRLVVDSPFNTFESLEKQASKPKYADSQLDF